jgi:glycosyltransferase involved in cell wall biosynthesis
MNVAIFASAFHPHVGGVEELCRQLAHAYRDAGHECIVLTNRWPRSLKRFEEHEGIPVYRPGFRVPEGGLKARCSFALTHRLARREVVEILRRHRIDVLHVQCVSANGYYALLAKRELKLPLVVTAQGELTMDAGRLYERSRFANRALHQLLDEADHVTACSKSTLNDLERWYGRPLEGRSQVIYNGIRLADFEAAQPYPHPRPYLLGIGRLVPQKGFDVLIEAFARANLRSHDLLIAGEGPDAEVLQRRAQGLGLNGRIRFVGRAERATAISLFKGCAFFVLPSRIEPMGIVNLEAMASGKAVIASDVGGVPELVRRGQAGLLVPPGDVECLASTIRSIAADEPLRQRLAAAGRERAAAFSWPAIAQQYLKIYSGCGEARGEALARTKCVTIADNSIVGANAVVTRDIPPNVIAAGVPARVLGVRSKAAEPVDSNPRSS